MIIETEQWKIEGDEVFNTLAENILSNNLYQKIIDFFRLKHFRQVRVQLFSKREDFIKCLQEEYNYTNYSSYTKGTFCGGAMQLDASAFDGSHEKMNYYTTTVFHELVHIINREKIYDKRVTWFDEGLAKCLTEKIGNCPILKGVILPKMNDISHEKRNFYTKEYDGYLLSKYAVAYLIKTMSKDDFFKMCKNSDLQLKAGETVLQEVMLQEHSH